MTQNKPSERSLAYHLLLPLFQFPATSLGPPENLLDVTLSDTHDVLVLEVQNAPFVSDQVFQSPHLKTSYHFPPTYWLQLQAPEEFLPEFQAFREGKWSHFSDKARELFRVQWSRNYPNTGKDFDTHLLYYVMSPKNAPQVRKYWERELDLWPSTLDGVELYHLPNERDLITI